MFGSTTAATLASEVTTSMASASATTGAHLVVWSIVSVFMPLDARYGRGQPNLSIDQSTDRCQYSRPVPTVVPMTKQTLRLAVIIGSTRAGRFGPVIANWFADQARQHGGVEVDLIDLAETNLPATITAFGEPV